MTYIHTLKFYRLLISLIFDSSTKLFIELYRDLNNFKNKLNPLILDNQIIRTVALRVCLSL
jgi:hypothetical protein